MSTRDEATAIEIVEHLDGTDSFDQCTSVIAAALTQARREGLEEAARIIGHSEGDIDFALFTIRATLRGGRRQARGLCRAATRGGRMTRHFVKHDRCADRERTCLMCGASFPSQGKSNRRCKDCCTRLLLHDKDSSEALRERMDGDYVYN